MKCSFPKRDKRHLHTQKWFPMSIPSLQIMFWKRALHICKIPTYIYLHICQELFPKSQSMNLALSMKTNFSEWRSTRLGKKSSSYLHQKNDRNQKQSYFTTLTENLSWGIFKCKLHCDHVIIILQKEIIILGSYLLYYIPAQNITLRQK